MTQEKERKNKKTQVKIIILALVTISLFFVLTWTSYSSNPAFNPTVPKGSTISLDGKVEEDWLDVSPASYQGGTATMKTFLKHDGTYLYVGIIYNGSEFSSQNKSFAEVVIDPNYNQGSVPQADDKKIYIDTDKFSPTAYFEGNNTNWTSISLPNGWLAITGNAKVGIKKYNSFEFQIPLADINFTSTSNKIGLSVHVQSNENGHTWFPNNYSSTNPPATEFCDNPSIYSTAFYGWNYETGAATLSSPSILSATGKIFVGTNSNVHTINRGNGQGSVLKDIGTQVVKRAPVGNINGVNTLLAAGANGRVYAINADNGNIIWQSNQLTDSFQGGLSVQFDVGGDPNKDYLIVGSYNASTTSNRVFALDLNNNGAVAGTFQPGNMDVVASTPSINYSQNVAYITSKAGGSGTQASLWAINTPDMTPKWSKNLGHISSSPAVGNGNNLYVATDSGVLYKFAPDGTQIWTVNVGSFVEGTPWVTGNKVYVATRTNGIYRFTDNGAIVSQDWRNATVIMPSSPLVSNKLSRLYAGSTDGKIYELSTDTGSTLKTYQVDANPITVGTPAFDSTLDYLVMGTSSRKIVSVHTPF